jgi:hypothetical protein
MFAKLMRVSTIDEYCDRAAHEILNRNQIDVQTIECHSVDRSEHNSALMERVYFGVGGKPEGAAAFIVMVDENAGIPFGYIVKEDGTTRIAELKAKYASYKRQEFAVNSFFFFSLGELGELAELV